MYRIFKVTMTMLSFSAFTCYYTYTLTWISKTSTVITLPLNERTSLQFIHCRLRFNITCERAICTIRIILPSHTITILHTVTLPLSFGVFRHISPLYVLNPCHHLMLCDFVIIVRINFINQNPVSIIEYEYVYKRYKFEASSVQIKHESQWNLL